MVEFDPLMNILQLVPKEVLLIKLKYFVEDLRKVRTILLENSDNQDSSYFVNRAIYLEFFKLLSNTYKQGDLLNRLSEVYSFPEDVVGTSTANTDADNYYATFLLAALAIERDRLLTDDRDRLAITNAIILPALAHGIFYTGLLMLSELKNTEAEDIPKKFEELRWRYGVVCVGKEFADPDNTFYLTPHILDRIVKGSQTVYIYIFDELVNSGKTMKEIISNNLEELIGSENMARIVIVESNRRVFRYNPTSDKFLDQNGRSLW